MDRTTFIVDLGTGEAKVQTYGAAFPFHFSTITARSRLKFESKESCSYLFDDDITTHKGILHMEPLISPFEILLLEPLKDFLIKIFTQIAIPTKDSNLIIGVPFHWSNEIIDKLKTLLFQNFDFQSIYCAPSELFSLYYYNLDHCTLIDSGFDTTRIIQYRNKKPVSNRIPSNKIAGAAVSRYLQDLLKITHPKIINKQFAKHLDRIKISKCFLSTSFENDLRRAEFLDEISEDVEIPQFMDTILMGIKKILAPEIIFRPFLANLSEAGVEELFTQVIQETHPSMRQQLFKDVIIIGGNTKFLNFTSRFTQQFDKIPLLSNTAIHHNLENADLIAWLGMKKFVDQGLYEQKAVTLTNFFARL